MVVLGLEATGRAAIALQRQRGARYRVAQSRQAVFVPISGRSGQQQVGGSQGRVFGQMVAQRRQAGLAGMVRGRLAVQHLQGLHQFHRGLPCQLASQQLPCRRTLAAGQGGAGIVAGHQQKLAWVVAQQGLPGPHRGAVRTSLEMALAGQHQRPRCTRRRRVSPVQRGLRIVGATLRVGFQRLLAFVVRHARRKTAGTGQFKRGGNGRGAWPFARAFVQRQQRQLRIAVKFAARQSAVRGLGAVEQPGLHEVLRQRMLGPVVVAGLEVAALQQVLVHTHGAFEFAAAPKQVAQRKVQFGGVGVVLHRFDEGIDGLVLLLIQQQVQAREVGPRRVAAGVL